jgi:hypothetical protein
MAKADRILRLFPAFYRAHDQTKLLAQVVTAMAAPLDEADSHLFRIQRAHRLLVAEHVEDIVRLAAILSLTSYHFEDLLSDRALPYDTVLALMRDRVERIARLHLRGLGTPWAVLESAATFLNATIVPDHEGDPLIKHLDSEGFSHSAIIEFDRTSGRPRSRIVLHESPFRRHKVEMQGRWPGENWMVENTSVEVSPIRVAIQGVGERTIGPTLFCPDIQAGLIFNGVVPMGKTLTIDAQEGARLDGDPVDTWLFTYKGGVFDYATADTNQWAVIYGEEGRSFTGSLDGNEGHRYGTALLPNPPLGLSRWYFGITVGVYEGTAYDFSVCDTPAEPIGRYDYDFNYDDCVFDYPPSAVIGMAWDERIPCSFKLLLPAHIPPPAGAEGADTERTEVNYVGRVGTVLPRFKGAGVRAFIDVAPAAWILGEGVLRDTGTAQGEGVTFNSTHLRDEYSDLLVQFDTQASA